MATDNSPPRIRVIVTTMGVAVIILIGLKFVLDSYYYSVMEEEEYAKVGSVPATDLAKLRAAEKKNLTTGRVPIDRAIKELTTKGREGDFKDLAVDIAPQTSDDTGPLVGWVKLAKDIPAPAASAAGSAAPGPAPATTIVDGGVASVLASDSGVLQVAAGAVDGSAPTATPDGGPKAAAEHDRKGLNRADAGLHP